jgi:predicted dehydrogenase
MLMLDARCSRRKFLRESGIGALSYLALSSVTSCKTKNTDQTKENIMDQKSSGKLGVALVGLGKYSSEELAPALQETDQCFLAGIVTGTPEKAEEWKSKYKIPESNIYNYENFDQIRENADIDIIYVVLPNSMHREFVVRAAQAGKHVICEKPMAITVEDCEAMINACKQAGKKLSIGYRLHFEPHNKEMMRLGSAKTFGQIKRLIAENGLREVDGWRVEQQLSGGGPLMDVGIYCVQGVRYTSGLEPIAVTAQEGEKKDKKKFRDVEEALSWQMEMSDGTIAECRTSYSEDLDLLRAEAENGWFELKPAYAYRGIKGKTSHEKMDFPQVNQQALQMDDFALAIKDNRPTPVPGEMGLQDVKILQAIYEAMRTGRRVEIA